MQNDPYIKIRMSELTRLQNHIALLQERLRVYEPPSQQIKLLATNGRPIDSPKEHPFSKTGPSSVLESFPATFSLEYALQHGATKNVLNTWRWRRYITRDGDKYTKTERYIERMKQTRLTTLDLETTAKMVSKIKQ